MLQSPPPPLLPAQSGRTGQSRGVDLVGQAQEGRDFSPGAFLGEDLHTQSIRRGDALRDAIGARWRWILRMRRLPGLLLLLFGSAVARSGTVTGTIMGPSGLPIRNGTLSFN